MDLLSIVSSVAGLLAIGRKISIGLYKFVDEVKSAPAEFKATADELSTLCSVLEQLEKSSKIQVMVDLNMVTMLFSSTSSINVWRPSANSTSK